LFKRNGGKIMIKDVSKILILIETVDPFDSAAMDEIDARVHSFRHGLLFMGMSETGTGFIYCRGRAYGFLETPNQYTRSRDALKAIRPAEWFPHLIKNPFGTWYGDNNNGDYPSPALPTEELAELHAILQAIAYDRATEKDKS
jgi:hypothetical protein